MASGCFYFYKTNYLGNNETNIGSLKQDNKESTVNKKMILKLQKRFKSESHNVYTEEIIKIVFCWNDDKRMQSIDSTETYAHGTNKDLVHEKEETI